MPLHLLGKKSWNVYNADNIARVRRDEAEAQAREEAEEQRLQQEDAVRRIGILRGEEVNERIPESDGDKLVAQQTTSRPHKRRRLQGEDDTDKENRWAKEDAELGQQATARISKRKTHDEPLHDDAGHIQLVTSQERDRQDLKQRRPLETESTGMRFQDAAGYKNNGQAPWYAKGSSRASASHDSLSALPEKNVWGDEDPRRREREMGRVASNDPLAFMKQAQRQLKQSEKDRNQWKSEQEAEIRQLQRESRGRHHRKHRSPAADDIPDLDLDAVDKRRDRSRSPRSRHSERERDYDRHRHHKHQHAYP